MPNFIQAVVSNVARTRDKLAKLDAKAQKNVADALKRAAVRIQKTAVQSIARGPKSGHIYPQVTKRPGKHASSNPRWSSAHQASAPGEAPAADTGNLMRNVKIAVEENGTVAYVYVSNAAPYGAALEFGTKDGKIQKRPFLRPAFLENKDDINQLIRDAYRVSKG